MKTQQRGRIVPPYRPGINRAGEVRIPACNLTLVDGRELAYWGRTKPQDAGGGVSITLSRWFCADGLTVMASLDPLPHLTIKSKPHFLHISISRPDRYPDWDEMVLAVEAIAGADLDMAMIKPKRADYINKHEYCMHFWELPVEWGLR